MCIGSIPIGGVIDPRPLLMRHLQSDFQRIYAHGGLFIVFADPKRTITDLSPILRTCKMSTIISKRRRFMARKYNRRSEDSEEFKRDALAISASSDVSDAQL